MKNLYDIILIVLCGMAMLAFGALIVGHLSSTGEQPKYYATGKEDGGNPFQAAAAVFMVLFVIAIILGFFV